MIFFLPAANCSPREAGFDQDDTVNEGIISPSDTFVCLKLLDEKSGCGGWLIGL
jgi:hypothetical protein